MNDYDLVESRSSQNEARFFSHGERPRGVLLKGPFGKGGTKVRNVGYNLLEFFLLIRPKSFVG